MHPPDRLLRKAGKLSYNVRKTTSAAATLRLSGTTLRHRSTITTSKFRKLTTSGGNLRTKLSLSKRDALKMSSHPAQAVREAPAGMVLIERPTAPVK